MAEVEAPVNSTGGEPSAVVEKKKNKKKGLISRVLGGIFRSGGSSEDYEKKLQNLSKEEASVHARLKRRALSSRSRSRNIIAISIALEVVAVAYAIITTRSEDLDWKMRAIRVLPMFGLPVVSTIIYSGLMSLTRMFDRKDQKTLERLRAERQAKIDELKERTNYYSTQQLIQRYDLDPAAKQAAATVLASKLGADTGLKVYLGDESNAKEPAGRSTDVELVQSTGLRHRRPSHIRSNSTGSATLSQFINETSMEYSDDGQEAADQNQRVVEHFKGPSPNDGGWFARIAALLVGEDPTQCYALICGNCHMHNGLARKEDFPYITYYCPHCHALNGSRQSDDHGSGRSSGRAAPTSPREGSITGGAGAASCLETVQEVPAGDENKVDAQDDG
ncbi:uncharacterized protein M6B38_122505 [Iris pallida]|uniref:Lunapark zinc ribbon domain-containing protein n=1 Tax=Iris pallida TaxID=29817 RepID=A0AAX6H2I2_IRIPA|nr:uncharacterized protein M6B38_122505 [Iris pallida]